MWKLIQRYITGQCTDEESRYIDEWMNRSQANRRLVDELRQIWELVPEENFEVNAQKALQRFKYKVRQNQASPTLENYSRGGLSGNKGHGTDPLNFYWETSSKYSWKNFLRVAAAILIAVGIGWYTGTHYSEPDKSAIEQPIAMQKIVTQRGKKAEVTFSDGSKVILNAASTLRFPKEFRGNMRKVYLNGEAYFEVVHNTKAPFLVVTDQAQIQDLGTKFNVRAWKEDKKVEVTVQDGEVAVSTNQPSTKQKKVILTKNEYTVVEPGEGSLDVEKVDYRDRLLWLNGGLYFDNAPFSEVIRQVERRFDVNYKIEDKDLLNIPYTGRFIKADLSEVQSVLSVTMDITFQPKGGQIIIRKKTHHNR